jgi:apolipoprotein N-acyltransferase
VAQAEGAPLPGGRHSDAIFGEYVRLSTQHPADLIVWPETAINAPLNLDPLRQQQLAELARKQNAHLLIGAGESERGRTYNSAYFIKPDGSIAGTYRKMDLVMFGEYVPGRQRFPFLKRYPIRPFDYTSGGGRVLFKAQDYTLSPLICFEAIFPAQTREVCRLGAQLVVIITSDAWAKDPNEVRIHSAVGPFRAIEARKYVVRAASIGRSAIYDPYGNTLAEVPFHENGVASAIVRPLGGLSTYHFWGDWPLAALSVLLFIVGLLRARRGSFAVAI